MTAILACLLVGSLLSGVKGVLVKAAVNGPAILPCSVPDPGDNTVRWFKNPNTILSMSLHVMAAYKKRMKIIQPYIGEWNLHIQHVQLGDAGSYSCRVDDDVKEQVDLVVETPPVIHNTHDMTFNEGDTGTLWCNATGSPTPTVRWFWKSPYQVDGIGQDSGVEGNRLLLHNITRYYDNIYICLASNSVAENQKEIQIYVNFSPEVEVLQNTVNATLGQEVTLHCAVTAYPMDGGLEWVFQNNNLPIHTSWKYEVATDTDLTEDYNTLFVSMTIRKGHLGDGDYGHYVCRTKNFSRGHSEKVVVLQNPDEDQNNVDDITDINV